MDSAALCCRIAGFCCLLRKLLFRSSVPHILLEGNRHKRRSGLLKEQASIKGMAPTVEDFNANGIWVISLTIPLVVFYQSNERVIVAPSHKGKSHEQHTLHLLQPNASSPSVKRLSNQLLGGPTSQGSLCIIIIIIHFFYIAFFKA